MTVALNSPVRLSTGEVTTIADLDAKGLIRFTTGTHTGPKRNGERPTVTHYHAEMIDGSGYWAIGRTAYLSRTGGTAAPTEQEQPEPLKRESPFIAKDSGTPWLAGGR
jgi:hypothetical protein